MAFDIYGPKSFFQIEGEDLRLFSLGSSYGVRTPNLIHLEKYFYSSIFIKPHKVQEYKMELLSLKNAYMDKEGPKLAKQKKIFTKDKTVLRSIIIQAFEKDVLYSHITGFLKICQEALDNRSGIECHGD